MPTHRNPFMTIAFPPMLLLLVGMGPQPTCIDAPDWPPTDGSTADAGPLERSDAQPRTADMGMADRPDDGRTDNEASSDADDGRGLTDSSTAQKTDTGPDGLVVDGGSALPEAGDIIFSELMVDPRLGPDRDAEWIEIYNTHPSASLSLRGCEIRDDGRDLYRIADDLWIQPEGFATLAPSTDETAVGFVADHPYSRLALSNSDDELVLSCNNVVIDELSYRRGAFPIRTGAAVALDPSKLDADENDEAASWCSAVDVYRSEGAAGEDRGTPGAANAPCGT